MDAPNDRPKTLEYLNHIQKNSDILLKLIDQRFDLGRNEPSNIKLVKATMDSNSFLNPIMQSSFLACYSKENLQQHWGTP